MPDKVLNIPLDFDPRQPPVSISLPPDSYIGTLGRTGYEWIRFTGLSRLKARFPDGKEHDEFSVPVDPDVQFLLSHYRRLEELMSQAQTKLHRVYLMDGLFEFSAFVRPEAVHVRAGIYRNSPFEPPFADSVVLQSDVYMAMWRSIANAIVKHGSKPYMP